MISDRKPSVCGRMVQRKMSRLSNLENNIGYWFGDISYLENALIHTSFANEQGMGRINSNERLEFLGDAILSVIVAEYLYNVSPAMPEGELTKHRASLVCEEALASYAREIRLGDFLLLGKGENKNGGAERDSILSDAFEAVLAAIYLDGGMNPATYFVMRFVSEQGEDYGTFRDYKTELQEIIQQNPEERVQYVLVGEEGPDHNKTFTFEVRLNDTNVIGRGSGRSKKEAEQNASREALSLMGK